MYKWMYEKIPILMYHRIAAISGDYLSIYPEVFEQHLLYLKKRGLTTITLGTLFDCMQKGQAVPPGSVILTFDDGYLDNYTNALPLLKKYKMKAIVFPVINWLGKNSGWESCPEQRHHLMMDWEHLRQWLDEGMDIGIHTLSHPSLSSLTSEEDIFRELEESRQAMKKWLGVDSDFVCYPYGDFDDRVKRIAKECGFKGALAILHGTASFDTDPYAMRRIAVFQKHRLWQFAVKVSGIQPIINLTQRCERQTRKFFKSRFK